MGSFLSINFNCDNELEQVKKELNDKNLILTQKNIEINRCLISLTRQKNEKLLLEQKYNKLKDYNKNLVNYTNKLKKDYLELVDENMDISNTLSKVYDERDILLREIEELQDSGK